ncbi:hypothetical protein E1176_06930 [Fulvivirga sp. RKSG066]|uniref:hypothetical protein n=1 Tax=Fulvivirga aurantia TaxID=2529383 RepID=UPI0012BC7689|nr:hypothetical protein [Fulvivirga aurantia]MTI20749.1 hypothetical protein [Fulvivirga aurantia]
MKSKNLLLIWVILGLICPLVSNVQAQLYQYDYHEYHTYNNGQNRIAFKWNTQTGESTRYYYDNDDWHESTASLPARPLGNPSQEGEIMMDYHEYYTEEGGQYRIVLVWNTKTGKSIRYYYDNNQWHESTASLPAAPLKSSGQIGEIMMAYHEYYTLEGGQYRIVLVWNTLTGEAIRYYYDNDKWNLSTADVP